jgi:glycosyltransferase involved in cell wall biosynthesis
MVLLRPCRYSEGREKVIVPAIGVGVTTLNRRPTLEKTIEHLCKFTPNSVPIVVVDDGSEVPYPKASHRNDTPQGIANAKNHCLRLLMAYRPEVEHIFLFDDDCHPLVYGWWRQFIEAGEHHLGYLHKNMNPDAHVEIYNDRKIFAMNRGTGCMLYYSREAIETVGGFRPDYGRWGFEHDDLSHRIMNAGLIRFPYQGVVGQWGIWNQDEFRHGESSIAEVERDPLRYSNKEIFEKYRWDSGYVPYE